MIATLKVVVVGVFTLLCLFVTVEVLRGPKVPKLPEPAPPCKDRYYPSGYSIACDPRARLETITEYTEDGPSPAVICRCERSDAGVE